MKRSSKITAATSRAKALAEINRVLNKKSVYKQKRASLQLRGRFAGPSGEAKFFDTVLNWSFDATGEVPATGQLVLIPQGVTESTRVGRKCSIISIHMRGVVVFTPGAAATASSVAYFYLVQDTQTNGAAAAVTDVLTSNNMSVAMRNMSNIDRFKVIKRFIIPLTSSAGVTTAYNTVNIPFEYYTGCQIPIEYSSTTGAIGEIRSNNLFILAGTEGSSDDTITMSGLCRVRFLDN